MNEGPNSARFAAGDRLDLFGKGRSYASSHFFRSTFHIFEEPHDPDFDTQYRFSRKRISIRRKRLSQRKIHANLRLAANSNSDSIRTNGKFVKLDVTL